jgi:hypothetical protein
MAIRYQTQSFPLPIPIYWAAFKWGNTRIFDHIKWHKYLKVMKKHSMANCRCWILMMNSESFWGANTLKICRFVKKKFKRSLRMLYDTLIETLQKQYFLKFSFNKQNTGPWRKRSNKITYFIFCWAGGGWPSKWLHFSQTGLIKSRPKFPWP